MGIRIDLLPRYVGLKRWFKRILGACVVLVGAFAAVLFLLYYHEQLRLATLTTNRDQIKERADAADAAAKEATAKQGEAKPYQDTVNFFVDAGRTGAERAALLDTIHKCIYGGAVVSLLDLSDGQNLKFTATLKTPDDYADFINTLRGGLNHTGLANVVFSGPDSVGGAGILGYPNDEIGKPATATGANGQSAAATPNGTNSTAATPENSLQFEVYHNTVTAQGKLREPITVPLAPGETAAPATGTPGAPGAAPPATPAPAR